MKRILEKTLGRLRSALLAPRSREELYRSLSAAVRSGLIDEDVRQMMGRAMQMSEKYVRDAMVPHTQMKLVQADASPQEWVRTIMETGHSRYPVVGKNQDDIRGILLAKDLLPLLDSEKPSREIIRAAYLVPESMRVDDLLSNLRLRRTHMAIVLDEHGSTAGLVTLEDAVEEIIGEIEDEHDKVLADPFRQIDTHTYEMDAATPIKEFNQRFSAALSENEVKTMGGFFARRLGHVPRMEESLEVKGFRFKVLKASLSKAEILQVTVFAADTEQEEEPENGSDSVTSQ